MRAAICACVRQSVPACGACGLGWGTLGNHGSSVRAAPGVLRADQTADRAADQTADQTADRAADSKSDPYI